MSATWGRKVRYTIYGESHGRGIGMVIDGLPPGLELNQDQIRCEMARRAPGRSSLATARSESDEYVIMSGFYQGKTTGTPLCCLIENRDARSADYAAESRKFRPGHADYTGHVKYERFNDPRGGGHFSGRLTAPLVLAGAIAKQLLCRRGIAIGSHIRQIGPVFDAAFEPADIGRDLLEQLAASDFAVLDSGQRTRMEECILAAKAAGDSVGGVIETAAVNLPAGRGEPFFDSLESVLAHLLFSVPAVKGVDFGTGFGLAAMRGSEANDALYSRDDQVRTYTNHNGGILGGITNGMPLVFRTVIKPTPSIGQEQQTVDETGENTTVVVKGRHDPCIVPRAVPVIEAVTAMAIWEVL